MYEKTFRIFWQSSSIEITEIDLRETIIGFSSDDKLELFIFMKTYVNRFMFASRHYLRMNTRA